MIGGFILGGATANAKVLVRALGPSLATAGVTNTLSYPTLELCDGNGVPLFANDNWKDQQQSAIEQTGIPPKDSMESAIHAELPAGTYTAIVAGKNNSFNLLISGPRCCRVAPTAELNRIGSHVEMLGISGLDNDPTMIVQSA